MHSGVSRIAINSHFDFLWINLPHPSQKSQLVAHSHEHIVFFRLLEWLTIQVSNQWGAYWYEMVSIWPAGKFTSCHAAFFSLKSNSNMIRLVIFLLLVPVCLANDIRSSSCLGSGAIPFRQAIASLVGLRLDDFEKRSGNELGFPKGRKFFH